MTVEMIPPKASDSCHFSVFNQFEYLQNKYFSKNL